MLIPSVEGGTDLGEVELPRILGRMFLCWYDQDSIVET